MQSFSVFSLSSMASSKDKRSWILMFLAPLVVLGIMISLWQTRIVQQLENVTMDWRFSARTVSDPAPDERIALIGIGEASLGKWGRWEEWTRDIHADFVTQLGWRPPKVIAYDFFFSEPSTDPENDYAFGDALAGHIGSITGTAIETEKDANLTGGSGMIGKTLPLPKVIGDPDKILGGSTANTPIQYIAESASTGIVNAPPSRIDGMRRSTPMIGRIGKDVYPSLTLQSLMQYSGATPEDVEVRLGESIVVKGATESWTIPINEKGFMWINYRNPEKFIVSDYAVIFEALQAFEKTENWFPELPPLEDQILIVGQAAAGLSDFGPTPHSGQEPLFKIQANALSNILQNDHLKQLPIWTVAFGWLLVAWVTLLALKKAHVVVAVITPFLVVAAFFALAFFLFQYRSIAIPLVLPMIGFVIIHATVLTDRLVAELREKQYIREVFGSFAPKQVVDQIIASGEMPKLGGHETSITMFFSDIQSFSSFSEKLSPERLVVLMNEYLTEMTGILMNGTGTLDKYIGDAIVGMFGAPLPTDEHAYLAVSAAIKMQARQAELREKWKSETHWPEIVERMQTRIGLNSGSAVIGHMGSPKRMNFTMMGDNVNLAARFESGAKKYGVYTMITEETYQKARLTKDDIAYRYIDRIIVEGRTTPVSAYEVVEFKDNLSVQQSECLELFAEGIKNYLNQDWNRAIHKFEKSATLEKWQPDRDEGIATNPSLVLIERCCEMRENPPGSGWDGVYKMTSK